MLIDVIMIVVVAAFAAAGYKRGLARSFAGLLSYILSAVLAVAFMPTVSEIISKTEFAQGLAERINEKYISGGALTTEGGFAAKYADMAREHAAEAVAQGISEIAVKAIAFIAVLILVRAAIFIIGKAFGIVLRFPVIKQINGLGGAIAGGFLGVLVLYTVFAAAAFVPMQGGFIEEEINSSSFAKGMYEENVLFNIR